MMADTPVVVQRIVDGAHQVQYLAHSGSATNDHSQNAVEAPLVLRPAQTQAANYRRFSYEDPEAANQPYFFIDHRGNRHYRSDLTDGEHRRADAYMDAFELLQLDFQRDPAQDHSGTPVRNQYRHTRTR